ncbi:MAG: NTP transferase domain-containing protein, partial [Campylobacterales bacterium]
MKAVLMAGGFGTRIQPLTNSLPKPMLPVLNRPMMEHILLKLRDMGISEVVVLLYFKPEVIQNYFGDGSRFGMTLHYVLPDDDYGTAGAVKKAQPYLDETFIIVSGDLVTDFDFAPIVEFHRAKASKLTLALTPVPDPLQFGVVIASPEGKIQKFLEKPAWGEVFSDTINTGIYILEPEVLDYIPEGMAYDFAKDLFPQMMKEGETLWAKTVLGYWRDVGNPESYRDVHADLLTGKVASSPVGHRVEYKKGVLYHGEGCLIPDDLYVEGLVILGDGVTIDREVELTNVVIGNRVRLDKRVKITGGVIWNDVYIGEKSTLVNVVICNDCRLGKKVKAKSGVIIAEGCEIGSGVSFERDVIVWPSKFIDEGSIVSNNIIWGDRYKTTIFEGGKVTGRTNMELSCDISVKLAEAFGSMLPVGSTVYVSRDYHNSSRMLKRAFLGGLLSTGVNVVDFKLSPSNVTRFHIAENKEAVAGIHFRRSVFNPMKTEILFFNESGLPIDTNTEKNCERIFFRENFRRVDFDKIGMLTERSSGFMEEYVRHFMT